MKYRREIDGLRAIAVLPVILFHAGIGLFSGGFVGVDVFFVISGYLITSIIVTELDRDSFSLARFYERRARRILPALFFVALTCLPFAWLWMFPQELKDFSQSLMAVAVFASNILFWQESGYFDSPALLKPLLHTWSLAIEEQYYLLFPLLLLLVWRFGRKRVVLLLAVLAASSLILAQWGALHKPAATFFLLPTRGWELLLGGFIAIYHSGPLPRRQAGGKHLGEAAGIAGILLIFAAVFAFDETTPFPSFYTLLPTLGTALIILYATPDTLIGRLLSARLLVGIGLISYSAYLWHQPFFAFARLRSAEPPSTILMLGLAAASLVAAWVSWRFVETPFRRKSAFTRGQVFSLALVASVAVLGLGAWGQISKDFKTLFIEYRLDEAEREIFLALERDTGGLLTDDMVDNGQCRFWAERVTPSFAERFTTCVQAHGPAIVVLGDSHAMNIYNALARAEAGDFVVGITRPGCRPRNSKNPNCDYEGFSHFLADNKSSVQVVLFHQSGAHLMRDESGRPDSAMLFEEGRAYTIAFDLMEKTTEYLETLTGAAPIVWLGPFAEARFDFRNLRGILENGLRIDPRILSMFDHLDGEIAHLVTKRAYGFRYLSLIDILQARSSFLKIGDCITFRDSDHLSVCGEAIVGAALKRSLEESAILPDPYISE